jgi:hypothetical protein
VGDPSAAPFSTALAKISGICNEKEEVHFWPSNYCRSLVLTIERENQESLAIELLKPFKFGHPAVLQSSFADVAATWRWAHISAPCLLPLLSSSSSLLRRRPSLHPPAPPSDGGARARPVSGTDPRGSSISLARRRCPRGELKLPAGPAEELEPFVGCSRCRETRRGRGVRRTSSKLWEEESRRHLRR